MIIRDVLECLYFITGGPLMAWLVWRGLSQIAAAEAAARSAAVQNERDSFKEATRQCEYFKDIIIPKYNELVGAGQNPRPSPIQSLQKTKIELDLDGVLKLIDNGVSMDHVKAEIEANAFQITQISNDLELFALHFIKKVADENIAFDPCAPTYCEIFTTLSQYIYRKHMTSGLFANSWELYVRWRKILKAREIAANEAKNQYQKANIAVPILEVKK